jgi:hypothetical protein
MYYLAAYYLMNLGAFGFLLYFEGVTGSETVDSLRGWAGRRRSCRSDGRVPDQPDGPPADGRLLRQVPALRRGLEREPRLARALAA